MKVPFTLFANFRIDSHERLLRMQDSYVSFSGSCIDQVVVNVRGDYREEALSFLKKSYNGDLHVFKLESKNGWHYDSRVMFDCIKNDVILFWIEDHICMGGSKALNQVISDFTSSQADYLEYSWFNEQFVLALNSLSHLTNQSSTLFSFKLCRSSKILRDKISCSVIGRPPYLISCPAIFSKRLFERVLFTRRPFLPRWPKTTPFDFEKRSDDLYVLDFMQAYLKSELFAAIDDDNLFEGSSLISRHLYPNRISREVLISERNSVDNIPSNYLPVDKISRRFCNKVYSVLNRLKYLLWG